MSRQWGAAWMAALLIPAAAFGQAELFVHNFHRVDEHVLRGAKPSEEGLRALAAEKVQTVLDLRPVDENRGTEKAEVESLGMKYVNIPMNGFHAPTDQQIEQALTVLENAALWPVFVHCHYGEDRTGTVIACYRIKHDHWENDRALQEARKIGMRPWEKGMKAYIRDFEPDRIATQTK